MNINLANTVAWPYFHPFYGEARIEGDGLLGLAESGINLAFWSAAVGFGSKLAGAKHPFRIAAITFGVFIAAEIVFGASGGHNGNSLQVTALAPTKATGLPYNGPVDRSAAGFGEEDEFSGFQEIGGYRNA